MDVVPDRFNLATYCLGESDCRPDGKPALVVFDHVDGAARLWRYAELRDQMRRIAGGFQAAGLARGQRIVLRMDNCAEYALAHFAAIGAGLVPIPASSMLTAAEVTYLMHDSGAAAIVLSPGLAPPAVAPGIVVFKQSDIADLAETGPSADFADTAADDPAYLVYTSGTTANPKGVLHAHRAAWGRRPMHDGWYGLTADDIVLHAGAFNWTYTIGTGLTDPWSRGATAVVYTGRKTPDIWPRLIRKCGATLFAGVPTLFRQILKYAPPGPINLGVLRHGLSAGESLARDIAAEWRERTGTQLLEAFGMSEISTYISTPAGRTPKPGSPGRPQPGRRVAIMAQHGDGTTPLPPGQTGIIGVHRSDPGLMLGYWNRPDEEDQMMRGEWFLTGDLAHIDADGDIHLSGRVDEMMNARGYRVSPLEVEAVLKQHSSVLEVAVRDCEASANVAIIAAFVVWRGKAAAEELLAHARIHLAAYKVPGEIIAVDALPRTVNGKLLRRTLCTLMNARSKY